MPVATEVKANKEAKGVQSPANGSGPNAPFSPELPAALQGNLKRDKKPFTYLPGGLDLSEIRSPKMQRRIMANQQHAPPPPPVMPQHNLQTANAANVAPQNAGHVQSQMEGLKISNGGRAPPGEYYQGGQTPDSDQQQKNFGQSRSFRILQMITDDDAPDSGAPVNAGEKPKEKKEESEMRFTGIKRDVIPSRAFQALQKITGGDEPVSNQYGDSSAPYQEECGAQGEESPVDIRYKGAYIPGKSFKMLQEMTGMNENGASSPGVVPSVLQQPRQQKKSPNLHLSIGGPCDSPQQPPKQYPQPSVPASQQAVEEAPKMYRGGRIPSQSFRMLQAMTGENEGGEEGTDM